MYYERLIGLRETYGVKQKELAEFLGLEKGGYWHCENEERVMPLKHLIKLCDYFEVSLDYMFGFTNIKRYKDYKNINIDSKLIGKRLKELRRSLNITQKSLAIDLDIDQSSVATYENGRYLISTSNLYTLCDTYHISADYLLGRIDRKEIVQDNSHE